MEILNYHKHFLTNTQKLKSSLGYTMDSICTGVINPMSPQNINDIVHKFVNICHGT